MPCLASGPHLPIKCPILRVLCSHSVALGSIVPDRLGGSASG